MMSGENVTEVVSDWRRCGDCPVSSQSAKDWAERIRLPLKSVKNANESRQNGLAGRQGFEPRTTSVFNSLTVCVLWSQRVGDQLITQWKAVR